MGRSQYIIQFGGLTTGTHEYEFNVTDKFFERIVESEIQQANITVLVSFVKQNSLMQMQFKLKGSVATACDRCLKDIDFPIETEGNLVIKYGNPEESNDEILVIPEGASEINISHYIYEYITLAVPARKVPCELDPSYTCDEETINKLNEHSTQEDEELNPLWDKLKNIKFN